MIAAAPEPASDRWVLARKESDSAGVGTWIRASDNQAAGQLGTVKSTTASASPLAACLPFVSTVFNTVVAAGKTFYYLNDATPDPIAVKPTGSSFLFPGRILL